MRRIAAFSSRRIAVPGLGEMRNGISRTPECFFMCIGKRDDEKFAHRKEDDVSIMLFEATERLSKRHASDAASSGELSSKLSRMSCRCAW
jgi:hypothetical protein